MPGPTIDRRHCERVAEKTATDLGFTCFPINPQEAAQRRGITVQPMPETMGDFSGALLGTGTTFGILYATNIANAGRVNFNIAHELGHFFLPGHPEALLESGRHLSTAGRSNQSSKYEKEADAFASAFLMPGDLCRKEISHSGLIGLAMIDRLQTVSEASMTAAALRYPKVVDIPVAVILSRDGLIEFSAVSAELKELAEETWMKPGSPVPRHTATHTVTASIASMTSGGPTKQDGQCKWSDWIEADDDQDVCEEVLWLGGYGKVLTVLTLDSDHG